MLGWKRHICYCSTPEDKALFGKLEEHFSLLKQSQEIAAWSDREIQADMDWEKEVEDHLKLLGTILLFVISSLLALISPTLLKWRKHWKVIKKGEQSLFLSFFAPFYGRKRPLANSRHFLNIKAAKWLGKEYE